MMKLFHYMGLCWTSFFFALGAQWLIIMSTSRFYWNEASAVNCLEISACPVWQVILDTPWFVFHAWISSSYLQCAANTASNWKPSLPGSVFCHLLTCSATLTTLGPFSVFLWGKWVFVQADHVVFWTILSSLFLPPNCSGVRMSCL